MNPIQAFIDKHDRIKVFQICLQKNGDDYFRKMVLGNNPYSVNLCVSDNGAIDSALYIIEVGTAKQGFFAEYRRTLNHLYYADAWGFIPYIKYSDEYVYAEKHPVNGAVNPFEYYFVQPCISEEDVNNYHYLVHSRECDIEFVNRLKPTNGYGFSDEYIDAMAKISKKYIRFNDTVKNYLERQTSELLRGRKTLGIHVRLTDFKQNYFGHPVCITADKHLALAKKLLSENKFEQVFLATDDIDTVEIFKKEFGDKVVSYSDVIRTTGDVSVAFLKDERENHHYLLGLEVLRDMYTLAMCAGLVAGKSQVSICAMIENKNHIPYEYVNIFDLGYNTDKSHLFSESL